MKIIYGAAFMLTALNINAQRDTIHYWRNYNADGIHVFETDKEDTAVFRNLDLRIGGSFTQQFQNLQHSNTAAEKLDVNGKNLNQLIEIGPGFNLATANLNIDVQLAEGVRMNVITFMSSRHHPEAWVKGGYLQFDKLPFMKSKFADKLMKYLTIRAGHYEINYGDAHFRRSDNGNTMYNPFVENYIMDAFTTEIGGELFFQRKGLLAMTAITNGEIQGAVTNPQRRNPAFIGKLGYDRQLFKDLRIRLTSSVYTTAGSVNNTLYGGDRSGSRYYLVMENILASSSVNAFSGRFNPGFNQFVTAVVINPFIKVRGLELFGNFEQATGKATSESLVRTWQQMGGDVVYRFGKEEKFYLAGRYNIVSGKLPIYLTDATIERIQAGAGWFVTKNILAKFEWVDQVYENFPETDIRNGGKFNGFIVEACVAF